MIRIRVALAFVVATLVALFGFAAPAQAANNGNHYGQLATHVNNGHHYGQFKKITTPPAPAPPPTPTPPPAPAPPPTTTVISVDTSQAGTLPVATSNAAWSYQTNVTLTAQACSGARCIHVVQVANTACGTGYVGCARYQADGSCLAQVIPSYTYEQVRAILEHETGHCLGLAHNYADPTSIMQPVLAFTAPLPGPDAIDRANVRALYP